MKASFSKKLTASYLFVVAVTLLWAGFYLTHRLREDYLSHLEQSLAAQAQLTSHVLTPELFHPAHPAALQDRVLELGREIHCRLTIIRADGVVAADSERTPEELLRMDNHLHRPEVQQALASGRGQTIRYSRTLQENMLYVAIPLLAERGARQPWGVLRVALPLTEVNRRVATFQQDLLKAGPPAIGIALLVALISVRKISRPLVTLAQTAQNIGQGRSPGVLAVNTPDEFGQLARTLSEMAERIEDKVRELGQERAQLAAILSALVESVVAVDHQGDVLFINPAAEKLFETTASVIKGKPFLEVLRHSPLNQVLTQTLHDRKPVTQEITLHAPQERTLVAHALPVSYSENKTGVLAALQDITELRRLERVRQEFVANVTHELKTPLTSIKGFVETLLDGAVDDPSHNREFLKTIQEHADRLSRLIDDILDLAALDAKRSDFRFEPLSLMDVTDRLIQGLAPLAQARKVTIINRLTADLPKVRADREKLAQIFLNLLDNAVKFNKAGGQVEISARTADGHLTVIVKDTGVGIPAADLPRIFERFYRVDKARSREMGGTGLGLSIVKHLVEAHHGTITVQSVPQQGSVFHFTLPLA